MSDSIRLAFDRSASTRSYDRDGRMHVSSANISKSVVNEYRGSEIPDSEALGLQADKIYRLLRPAEELEKAAPSFNNLPILSEHVPVTASKPRPDLVIGTTGTDAAFKAPYLTNSLAFWTGDAIQRIVDDETRELSSAYHYTAVPQAGTFDGQPYDLMMKDIIGNHVALVKKGRAGSDVVVGDAAPEVFFDPVLKLKDRVMPAKATLSRKAIGVRYALRAYLSPKLAQDAQIDLAPIVLGVTAKNYAQTKKTIANRLMTATAGKLAKDATLDDVTGLLDRLDGENEGEDDVEPGAAKDPADPQKSKDNPAPDEAGEEQGTGDIVEKICDMLDGKVPEELLEKIEDMADQHYGLDWGAKDGESPEERRARVAEGRDKAAKDRGARDKAARDSMMSKDRRGGRDRKGGKDEETEAEKKAREMKDASEKEAKDKKAMDAALVKTKTETIQLMRDINAAERFVHPWIGPIETPQDTPEAVYRLALDSLKVDVRDVPPSAAAYRAILNAQPKPGQPARGGPLVLAHDADTLTGLAKRVPNFNRLRTA